MQDLPQTSEAAWLEVLKQPGRALVLGVGASGTAAACLLASEGVEVLAVDGRPVVNGNLDTLRKAGVSVKDACPEVPDVHFDLAVVSPGVPEDHDWLKTLRSREVPFCSELELGWSRFRGQTLAVTGSNGKSTACLWCVEAFEQAGHTALPAGNYGLPVSSAVCGDPAPDWLVLEASSFQLETCRSFRADCSLFLNLAPNHLDRHGTMEAYFKAKANLFLRMNADDTAVVPASLVGRFPDDRSGCWLTFGVDDEPADWSYRGGKVISPEGHATSVTGTPFEGPVTGAGAAGVLAALGACGIKADTAAAAGRTMTRLPHRLEAVGSLGQVRFVNDSKATNLAAMEAALRRYGPGVRLIAGGRLKESNLKSLKEVLAETARGVYLIGEAAESMASVWADRVPCVPCGTLEHAVRVAWQEASEGDTILLSPGCASFDQFNSFEERGACFKRVVDALGKEETG